MTRGNETGAEPQATRLASAFITKHRGDLAGRLEKIEHCFGQLTEEDVWWRPHEGHNALGNIILHLCGNMRQWLINGIARRPDVRDRPAEFSTREPLAKEELMARLRDTIAEADAVLAGLTAAQLLEPRRIQGFDVTVMDAVVDSVSHLAGHTQEIVWITRLRLGEGYAFHWKPSGKEQGE